MPERKRINLEQKISTDNAVEAVRYLITEYYRLNPEPFFSVLSKNCVWILPGGQIVIGVEVIRAMFKDGFMMPPCQVEWSVSCWTGSQRQIGVFGTYALFSNVDSEAVLSEKQRVTMLFRKERRDDFRLYHLHVSNEWGALKEGEVFPIQISHQTYLYVQKLLRKSGQAKSRRVAIKAESAAYVFDPDMVLFIEANGRICAIHLLDRTMVVRQSITALEEQLPKHFCRIHRSSTVGLSPR